MPPSYPAGAVAHRFWQFVARTDMDSCWPWQGGKEKGYGRFCINGGHVMAHRYAWTLTHGPIPDGLRVLHACDNPPCCNPYHLFLGTMADNNADMLRKGRQRTTHGRENPNAKLTDETIRTIRAEVATGVSRRALAKRFYVNHSTINRIVSRQMWTHVW
jgi:HNH endonuclease